MHNYDKILEYLKDLNQNEKQKKSPKKTTSQSIAGLKQLAREIGKDQVLANRLYDTGRDDARNLAYLIAEPEKIDDELVLKWANGFQTKKMCDLACEYAFFNYKNIHTLIPDFIRSKNKYTKRAAFELIALLSMHGKELPDQYFIDFIDKNSIYFDEPDYQLRKSVLWGLSYIARRNEALKEKVRKFAQMLHFAESENSQWLSENLLKQI